MTKQLTLKEKVGGVRTLLEQSKEQIAMALPKHCTPERMLRIAMTAVQRTPKLLDCDPRTLIGAIVQASEMGLEPSNVLGHAYLVPFRNNKTKNLEVQLIPGYKGLVDLARRSGNVSTIFAHIVYEKDVFDFAYGLDPRCEHVPSNAADPGPMIAAYAVCRLRDGGAQFEVMWKRQVDAIRAISKAKDSGPWVTHYEEMAKKTVLRRLCKLLPVSVELQRLVALDERADVGLSQGMAHVVDFGDTEPEPPTTLDALSAPADDDPTPTEAEPTPDDPEADAARTQQAAEYREEIGKVRTAGDVARICGLLDNEKLLTPHHIKALKHSLNEAAKALGLTEPDRG